MLTTIGKQYVPALVREAAKSPCVYPAMSFAVEVVEVVMSSAKFSSLSPAKKKKASYRVIHAPRPKPELQSWNVHGTTTLSSAQTLMQLQGWNHNDPLSQLLGDLPDRFIQTTPAIDVIEMAKEMERIEEDALDEIAMSTGRASPSNEAMNHATNLKFPYYPQYASDLVDKAYEMENMKTSKSFPILKQACRPLDQAPPEYPQGASDLCDVAYQMEHPPEETTKPKKKVTDRLYPRYHPEMYGASDLVNKAFELDHPELMKKK
jgi:hypothetical protein